jgi:hypothetical protein
MSPTRTNVLLATVESALADAFRDVRDAIARLDALAEVLAEIPDGVGSRGFPACRFPATQLAEYATLTRGVESSLWNLEMLESLFTGIVPGGTKVFLARFEEAEAPALVLAECC